MTRTQVRAPDWVSRPVGRVLSPPLRWVRRKHSEAVALIRTIMAPSSPPQIELEAGALFSIAESRSAKEATSRMRQLITDGIQADGTTLRAMVLESSDTERKAADQLAKVIEGKAPIPSDW